MQVKNHFSFIVIIYIIVVIIVTFILFLSKLLESLEKNSATEFEWYGLPLPIDYFG